MTLIFKLRQAYLVSILIFDLSTTNNLIDSNLDDLSIYISEICFPLTLLD